MVASGLGPVPSRGEVSLVKLANGPEWNRYLDVIECDTGLERARLQPTARFIRDLGLG